MLDLDEFAAALSGAVAKGLDGGAGRICELCVHSLSVGGAAVALMADVNRREIVYASDDVAAELEKLQFSLGEGPCVEAFSSGRPVLVADMDTVPDARWPMFAAAASGRTTARAAYAFPLQVGVIAIGVLDLYRPQAGLLGSTQLTGALMAADAVLWVLLGLRAGIADKDVVVDGAGRLPVGSGAPSAVHQATGMIMAQVGVPPETALARLRASAFVQERLIDEVAAEVVARRLRFDKEDG